MNIFQALILGLVQGVAEFLPISSSGHLKIVEKLMGLSAADGNFAFFNVMLHVGTLIAVLIAFREDLSILLRELFSMIRGGSSRRDKTANIPARRLILLLLLSLLPLFIVLPFKSLIESLGSGAHAMVFIGVMLICTGMLLYFSDRFAKGEKDEKTMTVADSLLVGAAQTLAVVPGLSRSATTITAGMMRGMDRSFAVRFSFLMSIPTVLGALLLELIDAIKNGLGDISIWLCLFGMVVAGVSGFFAIRLLRKMAEREKFGGFAFWCWGAGLFALLISLIS